MSREFYYFNPRITERLNRIQRRPLTIVSAHKSSGKRTAVRAYLSNIKGIKLWHAIMDPPFDSWLASFQSILGETFPELKDTELFRCSLAGAADPVSDAAMLLRRRTSGAALFYVLEMCGEMNAEILRFLYQLAMQDIRGLSLIVLTQSPDSGGFQRDTDSRVNLIAGECFLFDQTDIRTGFGKMGIELSAEDAALLFHVTNGWAPLVSALFREIDQRGKCRVWETLPHRLAQWEEKLDPAEVLGHSKALHRLLVGMSPTEAFTLADAEEIDAAAGGLLSKDALFPAKIISPGKLPFFVYYDAESGYYHPHPLLRARLLREFRELPGEDRAALLAAHESLRAKGGRGETALRETEKLLLSLELEAGRKKLWAMGAEAETLRADVRCRMQILKAWYAVMAGQAQSAVSALEEEIRAFYTAGRNAEGEILILGSAFLKYFLGNEYLRGMEVFENWSPQSEGNRTASIHGTVLLLRAMNLFRRGDMPQLEALLAGVQLPDRQKSTICKLLLAIALDAQKRPDEARKCVESALSGAVEEHLILPFLPFYDQIYHLLPSDSDAAGQAFLEEVKQKINAHRRSMRKNYEKKQNAYGAALTRRQSEAVELAAEGLTNKEIAQRMNVSENTVKTMLRMAFRKLNITRRKDLSTLRKDA